jgi:hypothetical protein
MAALVPNLSLTLTIIIGSPPPDGALGAAGCLVCGGALFCGGFSRGGERERRLSRYPRSSRRLSPP